MHTSVILADKGAGDATDDARPSGLVILTGIQQCNLSTNLYNFFPHNTKRSILFLMCDLKFDFIVQEALARFYRFIWNLFYAEYIIYPFI